MGRIFVASVPLLHAAFQSASNVYMRQNVSWALFTQYFTCQKQEGTPPAAAAGQECDTLVKSVDKTPEDLGIAFEGFLPGNPAPGMQ